MADRIEVYEVIHSSPIITTVLEYILDQDSPAYKYKDNPDSFLEVKNTSGITNRQSIEATYRTKAEKANVGKSAKELPIKVGTLLAIEKQNANQAGLLTEGLEVTSYDVNAFKARALAELESKEGYAIVDSLKPLKGKRSLGTAKDTYPDETVWVWCRSLASADNNYEGEIFNLTPFIQRVNTNVGKSGGNFDLVLPPLVCVKNAEGKWSIKKKSLLFYSTKKHLSQQGQGFVADENLYQQDESGELIRNAFLFHTILSPNDLVYIRFESLKLEATQRIQDSESLLISKTQLPDRIYDMIGLIDRNGIKTSPSDVDVSIAVSGRDLSKLLIEDGAYFFALEMSQGMLGGPGSANSTSNGLTKRLSYNNGLQYLGLYFNNSIEKVFKFVINQLSNIKIVPDSLFSSYGSRRNTRFEEKVDGDQDVRSNQLVSLQEDAHRSIASLRRVNGLTLPQSANEKDAVIQIFNEHKRFQKTIRENKSRKIDDNNTVGWSSFDYTNIANVTEVIEEDAFPTFFSEKLYIIRETQYVPQAAPIIVAVDKILDIEESQPKYQKGLQRQLAPGIWQIIKLVIDKSVLSRRIVDSSISSANGSLMNFFRKVCQEPFVEYYSDTYGDTFNLIVRKPPTDRKSIMSMLNAQVETEELTATAVTDQGEVLKFTDTKVTPLIVDIYAEDVISEDLSFDDNEAYSWYHLQPQAVFQGNSNHFSLAYLPAVFFEEYAEIWGSKPFQVSHNYMPIVPRDIDQKSMSIIEQQAVEDMKFIIESHAYLPFTRRGSIVINGDRRHKIGNLVRYVPTGEIFMIDHVGNSFIAGDSSIDRTTTLQVSRGMVEQLIYGVPLADAITGEVVTYASYFNIINTNPNYEYKNLTEFIAEKIKVGEDSLNSVLKESIKVIESNVSDVAILDSGNQNTHLLESYSPEVKSRFIQLINAINARGYKVIVNSTKRSFQQQLALYNSQKNNSTLRAAAPGHSTHEKGLSMDLNLINESGQVITGKFNQVAWLSTGIPQLAKILGFKWGGDAFTNNYDPVHFQLITIKTQSEEKIAQSLYKERMVAVPNKSLDTAKIFSNFHVNKKVFEFFLRRDQFDKRFIKSNNVFIDTDEKGRVQNSSSVTITSKRK